MGQTGRYSSPVAIYGGDCVQQVRKWSSHFGESRESFLYYRGRLATVRFGGSLTPLFKVEVGVLQGDPLSIKEKVKSWATAKITIENKWLEIFHHFETNHVPYNNALKIVEYVLSLPGTNATTERVFSTVNKCGHQKNHN